MSFPIRKGKRRMSHGSTELIIRSVMSLFLYGNWYAIWFLLSCVSPSQGFSSFHSALSTEVLIFFVPSTPHPLQWAAFISFHSHLIFSKSIVLLNRSYSLPFSFLPSVTFILSRQCVVKSDLLPHGYYDIIILRTPLREDSSHRVRVSILHLDHLLGWCLQVRETRPLLALGKDPRLTVEDVIIYH